MTDTAKHELTWGPGFRVSGDEASIDAVLGMVTQAGRPTRAMLNAASSVWHQGSAETIRAALSAAQPPTTPGESEKCHYPECDCETPCKFPRALPPEPEALAGVRTALTIALSELDDATEETAFEAISKAQAHIQAALARLRPEPAPEVVAALKVLSEMKLSFDGFSPDPAELIFRGRTIGVIRVADDHAALQLAIDQARAALARSDAKGGTHG